MNIIAKILFDVKGDIQQRFSIFRVEVLYCLLVPDFDSGESNSHLAANNFKKISPPQIGRGIVITDVEYPAP